MKSLNTYLDSSAYHVRMCDKFVCVLVCMYMCEYVHVCCEPDELTQIYGLSICEDIRICDTYRYGDTMIEYCIVIRAERL